MAAVAAEDAAIVPAPVEARRQIADLRLFAGAQSFTASGTARFRELQAEADDVAQSARCMMIPALQDMHHVAH